MRVGGLFWPRFGGRRAGSLTRLARTRCPADASTHAVVAYRRAYSDFRPRDLPLGCIRTISPSDRFSAVAVVGGTCDSCPNRHLSSWLYLDGRYCLVHSNQVSSHAITPPGPLSYGFVDRRRRVGKEIESGWQVLQMEMASIVGCGCRRSKRRRREIGRLWCRESPG